MKKIENLRLKKKLEDLFARNDVVAKDEHLADKVIKVIEKMSNQSQKQPEGYVFESNKKFYKLYPHTEPEKQE